MPSIKNRRRAKRRAEKLVEESLDALARRDRPAASADRSRGDPRRAGRVHRAHRAVRLVRARRGSHAERRDPAPALLAPDECVALRGLFDDDARFEHDVEIDDDRGRVRYRFFRRPLPVLVDALRAEVYARLTPIAGLYGRQPVMHGVQEVRAERYAVGIPFHDYAGG